MERQFTALEHYYRAMSSYIQSVPITNALSDAAREKMIEYTQTCVDCALDVPDSKNVRTQLLDFRSKCRDLIEKLRVGTPRKSEFVASTFAIQQSFERLSGAVTSKTPSGKQLAKMAEEEHCRREIDAMESECRQKEALIVKAREEYRAADEKSDRRACYDAMDRIRALEMEISDLYSKIELYNDAIRTQDYTMIPRNSRQEVRPAAAQANSGKVAKEDRTDHRKSRTLPQSATQDPSQPVYLKPLARGGDDEEDFGSSRARSRK